MQGYGPEQGCVLRAVVCITRGCVEVSKWHCMYGARHGMGLVGMLHEVWHCGAICVRCLVGVQGHAGLYAWLYAEL